MAAHALPPHNVEHPAPLRDRVGIGALWFGLTAAPFAWSVQQLASTAFVGRDCFPHAFPLTAPLRQGLWPILLAISLAGIVLAIAGGVVSWRNWRQTRHERPDSAHHLLDTGEGRTRFMGMSGMMTSALFLIALVFGTAALFMVPLCGG